MLPVPACSVPQHALCLSATHGSHPARSLFAVAFLRSLKLGSTTSDPLAEVSTGLNIRVLTLVTALPGTQRKLQDQF